MVAGASVLQARKGWRSCSRRLLRLQHSHSTITQGGVLLENRRLSEQPGRHGDLPEEPSQNTPGTLRSFLKIIALKSQTLESAFVQMQEVFTDHHQDLTPPPPPPPPKQPWQTFILVFGAPPIISAVWRLGKHTRSCPTHSLHTPLTERLRETC